MFSSDGMFTTARPSVYCRESELLATALNFYNDGRCQLHGSAAVSRDDELAAAYPGSIDPAELLPADREVFETVFNALAHKLSRRGY